ncbi:threonine ammonia-lyase IlvA [Aureibacter tunicatorum]|uniref:L-threonine dehydratase n=1 Tax=Aureibacter tunicatorum TaxID=866807 RepID=A0AAE3XJU3_9BACT|nr:threonine ammonia-lyase IlvA [Aureibacter tunicatorum]MDR6239091.1 threonine dehydratase [Aureibacter tunicatorum]BDD04983.1 L-threonine dehydratase biosynthetic IlvA [Aureibacter tunicatorum]
MPSDNITNTNVLGIDTIQLAYQRIKNVVSKTPLQRSKNLSDKYNANIFLKREDLQIVRSYKIRGAYNKISSLNSDEQAKGIVCASAGNHAQGVAYSCFDLKIKGKIFMPSTTPKQKVNQVRMFGKDYVEVILTGDTFDDAYNKALDTCEKEGMTFIHPFDDEKVMAGQGTVGLEILLDAEEPIDYIFVAIGGGGLASGLGSYIKQISPHTKIIGIEPEGAPAMKNSLQAGKVVKLDNIEKFVDGAAVQQVGLNTFETCKEVLDDVILVPEGKACTTILKLYNEEAIVVEPAGSLSVASLDFFQEEIKGKNVVCLISGGNNDIMRTEEIKERSLLYEGLKHYFIVTFPQRAGALREFLVNVLGPNDDITLFEYTKKNSRENGPALVGIESKSKEDYDELIKRMDKFKINYRLLNDEPGLFHYLI